MRANPNNKYFFDPPQSISKTAEEEKSLQKAKAENLSIWERIGYRSIIPRLVKLGYFDRPDTSAIIAVRRAKMKEAVRILSIENAT